MDRRAFLLGAAALVALPARASEPPEVSRLRAALEAARRVGKPLLVWIVPATPEARWQQGGAFGDLLHLADDEALARLALVESVFATVAAVHAITRPWAFVSGPQQFELLETDPRIDGRGLPAWTLPRPWVAYGADAPGRGSASRESNRTRLAQSLGAIAPSRELLALRAGQAAAVVPEARRRRLWRRIERERPVDPDEVWAQAAVLLANAESVPALRPRVLSLLAAATRARLVERDPPGARWVHPAPGELGPSGEVPYLIFAR